MNRILAIDYGRKRTGLAVTDPERIIATALDTVPTSTLLDYLTAYIAREAVGLFILGQPMRMHYEVSEIEKDILIFMRKLQQKWPDIPVERVDERFTSKMAFQTMIDSGLKKKDRRDKSLIDKISAVIILQSYMESVKNKER